MKQFYVYIMASKPWGTLYIGVTSDLARRAGEHRNGEVPGFTRKYGVKTLVYFEVIERAEEAIAREKAMKAWKRAWKVQLIERTNPAWRDLFHDIV